VYVYRLPYNVVVACYACTAEGASGVNLIHSLIIIYIVCLIDVTIYDVSYFKKMDRIHLSDRAIKRLKHGCFSG